MAFLEYLADPSTQRSLLAQSGEHLFLTLVPVSIAIVLGVGLGIWAHRVPALSRTIVGATSTVLTIPSLALFAIFVPLVGIGNTAPMIALTLYALLPIVRNTVSGLYSVDNAVVESAKGMGMGATKRLMRIELPNAWPVMLAGIRVATLLTIGIASIAVLAGGDGLGTEIFRGLRRIGSAGAFESLLGGTLAVVVLALLIDLVYLAIGRLTIPRGIRE